MLHWVLISIAIVLLVLLFLVENFKARNGPPGPWRFPILGTLPQIMLVDPIFFKAFDKLSKRYGDVMSVKMGVMEAVVVSSYDAMRNILHREESFGRYISGVLLERIGSPSRSLVCASGPPWEKMRKYCNDTMREFGFGDRTMTQEILHEHFEQFMNNVLEKDRKKAEDNVIYIQTSYFYPVFVRVILSVLTGINYALDDENVRNLTREIHRWMKSSKVAGGIGNAFPFLLHIFPNALGYNAQKTGAENVTKISQIFLDSFRKDYKVRGSPNSFVEHFIEQIENDVAKNEEERFFTDEQFCLVFSDIVIAGFETNSTLLTYILLLLASYPEVQRKLQIEISNVVGLDRKPMLEDKLNLPYTQAVILESSRWTRPVVVPFPKLAIRDFKYNDYTIKQGTALMSNMHSVLYDENFWGDPEVFNPSRFLDKNGNINNRLADRVLIFGTGKRNCMGETLGRDGLFLSVTTLLQRYKFELPTDRQKPSLDPVIGFTLDPKPYYIQVKAI